MKQTIFKGSGVAIITPMLEDGSVNYPVLKELLEQQIAGGTDAIVICGTTGEASALNDTEHLDVIEFACATVNRRLPVIAGTGSNDTRHAVALSREAKSRGADALLQVTPYYNKTSRRAGAYSQKGKVSNLKEMNETFNYLRANGIYSLEDLEHRVSEHSAATESLKKTLDEQTARMKAIKQLYDSSAAFQSLKPVYDGLQKIKFEKPRAKYKAEHETELKQFYAARRKLTGEFPDGKVDMKKLTEEYDELEQAHNTTYGEFKTVRDDLHRLWKVKSCVDTAARFNERTEEQMHQNRPQTRQKKEDISR